MSHQPPSYKYGITTIILVKQNDIYHDFDYHIHRGDDIVNYASEFNSRLEQLPMILDHLIYEARLRRDSNALQMLTYIKDTVLEQIDHKKRDRKGLFS